MLTTKHTEDTKASNDLEGFDLESWDSGSRWSITFIFVSFVCFAVSYSVLGEFLRLVLMSASVLLGVVSGVALGAEMPARPNILWFLVTTCPRPSLATARSQFRLPVWIGSRARARSSPALSLPRRSARRRARLNRWMDETNDHGRQPESEKMYDSDMAVYLDESKKSAKQRKVLENNIRPMKQWAKEGK